MKVRDRMSPGLAAVVVVLGGCGSSSSSGQDVVTRPDVVEVVVAPPPDCATGDCGSSSSGGQDAVTRPDVAEVEVTQPPECATDGECDDGNGCTKDLCNVQGRCEHLGQAGLECDDGDACTSGDACNDDGACVGAKTLVCEDDNPCTTDSCDAATGGCSFSAIDGAMECDGALCTQGDECQDGTCVAGAVVACPDPDEDDCSYPVCNPLSGFCEVSGLHPAGRPCSDGNPCTDNDVCGAEGACLPGTLHACESQQPCIISWCNEQAKEGTNPCVMEFLREGTPCDDGKQCTENDVCILLEGGAGIQCQGTPLECNDGNECTLDSCEEGSGCGHEEKADGTLCGPPGDCNQQSVCEAGQCVVKPGAGCDDMVACTIDQCSPDGQCTHIPNNAACDDGNECNGVEYCDPAAGCLVGAPGSCSDGIACTVDSCGDTGCTHVPSDSLCDDGDPCTEDVCDPLAGCDHDPMVCPAGQQCVNGVCTPECVPVDGGWSDWSCGPCTGGSPCESGWQECTRTCSNPPPSCGGQDCSGPSSEVFSCGAWTGESLPLATGSHTYDKCGQVISGTVPADKSVVQVQLWGAGGGGGAPGAGGGGAYVSGTLAVTPGDQLELRVGCGGQAENGGGGATYVFKNGTVVMVAAGGGGGGSDGCSGCSLQDQGPTAGAGGGGGAAGGPGMPGLPNNHLKCNAGGGQGGTQTAGGAGGIINNQSQYSTCTINGNPGAANAGGANHSSQCMPGKAASFALGGCSGCGNGCGGGGGAGYFGGGGGSSMWTYAGGGGGGGSSYTDAWQVTNVTSSAGSGSNPGGATAPGYNGTAGRGGQGETAPFDPAKKAQSGSDGQIIIVL